MIKTPSHPFTFRIVLLIVGIIAIPLFAVVALRSTDNRSKASYNGLQQCLSRCAGSGGIGLKFFADKSAQCKLDCQKVVVDKSLTCADFCSRNAVDRGNSQGTNDGKSSGPSCLSQCQTWSDTKPCGGADGSQCSLGACPPGAMCKLKSGVCKNHVCVPETSSTDGSCTGEGTSCIVEKCVGYDCPPGKTCPAMPRTCTKNPGICRNSRCVSNDARPSGPIGKPSCRLADSEKTEVTWGPWSSDKKQRMKTTCTTKTVNCSSTTSCKTAAVDAPSNQ